MVFSALTSTYMATKKARKKRTPQERVINSEADNSVFGPTRGWTSPFWKDQIVTKRFRVEQISCSRECWELNSWGSNYIRASGCVSFKVIFLQTSRLASFLGWCWHPQYCHKEGGSSRFSLHEIATDLKNLYDFLPKDMWTKSSFEQMKWVEIVSSEAFKDGSNQVFPDGHQKKCN